MCVSVRSTLKHASKAGSVGSGLATGFLKFICLRQIPICMPSQAIVLRLVTTPWVNFLSEIYLEGSQPCKKPLYECVWAHKGSCQDVCGLVPASHFIAVVRKRSLGF